MARKKVIILGAGLSGLSAAWHLQKRGINCLVFEKERQAGGLCRSKKINGFTFDYDGHLLHFREARTLNFIRGLLNGNILRHSRSAWVHCFGVDIRYPFQANLFRLPEKIKKDCIRGFMQASNNAGTGSVRELSFLDWIKQRLGNGIARHFMVPYNSKFWTVSPRELNCGWLGGFVPVPTLKQVIKGARQDNKNRFGYNAEFWYPEKGSINQIPEAFLSQIKNIYLGCGITGINLDKKEISLGGVKEKFDYLVSTLPLPELPALINALPEEISSSFLKLKWNSVFNLNLGLERKDNLNRHWIYFSESKFCFFRVGFPHNYSRSNVPEGKSALYAEVSYSKNKPIDKKNIVSCIKKDLKSAGLLFSGDRICAEDINDIKYGYPVYDKHYYSARGKIIAFLKKNNIITCGRYGNWKYMSMEDALIDGERAAGNIIKLVT